MIIKPQKHRIAFVLNTLYYPFTYPEIFESLAKRGYLIQAAPPTPLPSGARVYVGGYLAMKQGCFIEINGDRKIIACEGNSIDNVIASAKDIIGLSETDFQLNMREDIDYCELISDVVVSSNSNPLEEIKSFSGDQYRAFDEILGTESAGFSIRIIPKNGTPKDKKWFDISLVPRFTTADKEYYVEVVFRNEKDTDSVLDFASRVHAKIESIINEIGRS